MSRDERKELTAFKHLVQVAKQKGALIEVQWSPDDFTDDKKKITTESGNDTKENN